MNTTDREFRTTVLTALLHDIGKFWQRTGQHRDKTHPELSSWFVREHLGPNWQEVENAVGYHHLPAATTAGNQRLALTVVLADWLAAGERRELPEGETGAPADDALLAIFSRLKDSPGPAARYPLQPLPADGSLLPDPAHAAGREVYCELWQEFTAECQHIARDNFDMLVSQLLALLEKYTMFVPAAAWRSETDISLYHHLKSTAAIASCLHAANVETAELNAILDNFTASRQTIAYLVGGDLSGIQDFIYNLRAKGALKGLRGRSLYLQLLPEAVAGLILDSFHLTRCNLLYSGGGHFYLLVPATANTKSQLAATAQQVEQTLLTAHAGRLSMAIATQPLTPADFTQQGFGQAWDNLHAQLANEKRHRFASLLTTPDRLAAVLGPTGIGGEAPACSVCGEETDQPDAEARCPLCSSFAELGQSLHTATVLVETTAPAKPTLPRRWHEVLAAFNRSYRFDRTPGQSGLAFQLNRTEAVTSGLAGFRFLARHVPTRNGTTAELEDIAEQATGIRRWGVLRMDVDNLGQTFRTGLGDNRSISRLSMLSYLLGYFFAARVQAIAQEQAYADKVYLAYSGGDDLFAIGAWSVLPEFACRIRDEFRKFTAGSLTLSGGIFVAPTEKFPVYEAAALAGEAEHAAKHQGRNRLSFLGGVITWQDLPKIVNIKNTLTGLIKDNLPRSILSILRSSWQQQQAAQDGRIPVYPIWRLLYALRRLQERHKELAERIADLESRVIGANGLHPHLDLAVRWTEYESRVSRRTDESKTA